MSEAKYHLWIPESEVSNVEKTPTGRSNQYNLVHTVHGQMLFQGLQNVAHYFQSLQVSDFLDDRDPLIFKVILQDKEDISVQKGFIENEGLTINAVKDGQHAIVSAPRDIFGRLQGRVLRYRDKGTKKSFQYIQGFEPFTADDKNSPSIRRFFKDNPDATSVDVQIMLLPDMDPDVQMRAQFNITNRIHKKNGVLQGDPYRLTDGTTIICACLSPSELNEISGDPRIYRVEKTAFYQSFQPSEVNPITEPLNLDLSVDMSALPAVVVLDDGVSMPPSLESVVPVHWQASGCTKPGTFGNHGTSVASRVAFRYVGEHMKDGCLTPRARIIDAQILDSKTIPESIVLQRIRETVETFADVAKIFNFCYNLNTSIEGDTISFLGSELDLLSRKYGIRFVLSAGNHHLYETQNSLKDIISDDESRIAAPADAMFGITVGAIVNTGHRYSLSKAGDIAPYSRRGPGFLGFYKPDLVSYGANICDIGVVLPDPYAMCLSKKGFSAHLGTSFTAPIVAGDLAQILTVIPNNDIMLAQALLYNGVKPLYDKVNMQQDQIDLASNLYGRGLSTPENSMYSSDNRVSYLHSGTMNRRTKKRVKFYIPSAIADLKVKRGEKKIRVTVTCVTQPPVSAAKGSQYSAAYISASIHKLNTNSKNVVANPSVNVNRSKWDTCCHFSNEFSSFHSGSWEVWLDLFTRWGIGDNEEIPYSLVITVEDLTAAGILYSETIKETAGRFTQIQPVRVKVR